MTAPKTRVLWLTKGLGRGGAEVLLRELAVAIDRTSVDIDVAYVLPHKDALVDDLEAAGVTVHCLSTGRPGSWLQSLRRLLVEHRYDVIHSHSPIAGAAARVLAPRDSVLAHTEHNVWGRYRRPTRLVNAVTIHRNAVVWAVSQGVADSIRPPLGRDSLNVEVMLHGLAPSTVSHDAEARAESRRRLGLRADDYVVGTVGNLTPKKDHDTMIRAFAAFSLRHDSARLVIIGAGPREEYLRHRVAALGLSEKVLLTGARSDVPELLVGFDQFVLSSLHEGLSIALIEGMAAGLPIVATRVGGIPELVTHEKHGLLVEAGDDRGLAHAMERVADEPELRRRFTTQGAERALEFGIDRAADRLTAEYARLARRGRVSIP